MVHTNRTEISYNDVFVCVCLQVPLGLTKEGLPTGIQVVGAPYQDHLTLAVAAELERGLGGWVSPGGDDQ
jgi:Asp-tRNA(Asn)/Glu-tRNA(Gln) amidotransferase A subunit family amidase